jgi:hypothetical protein
MASRFVLAVLLVVGVVQLLPGIVAFAPALSKVFYGVALADDTAALLLRHRAVLLALVGLLLFAGAASAPLRVPAIAAALLSKLAYLGLYAATAAPAPEVGRVAKVDLVTALLLIAAGVVLWRSPGATSE